MAKKFLSILLALTMILSLFSISVFADDEIKYKDWDETKNDIVTRKISISKCESITADTGKMEQNWYIVEGEITIDHNLTIKTDTNILLREGSKLTVNGKVFCRDGDYNLNIYGEKGSTPEIEINVNTATSIVQVKNLKIVDAELRANAKNIEDDSKKHSGISVTNNCDVYNGRIKVNINKTVKTAYIGINIGNKLNSDNSVVRSEVPQGNSNNRGIKAKDVNTNGGKLKASGNIGIYINENGTIELNNNTEFSAMGAERAVRLKNKDNFTTDESIKLYASEKNGADTPDSIFKNEKLRDYKLIQSGSHQHEFLYSTDTNTIKATCIEPLCDLDKKEFIIKIKQSSENLCAFDGIKIDDSKWGNEDLQGYVVSLTDSKGNPVITPTDGGLYKAILSLESDTNIRVQKDFRLYVARINSEDGTGHTTLKNAVKDTKRTNENIYLYADISSNTNIVVDTETDITIYLNGFSNDANIMPGDGYEMISTHNTATDTYSFRKKFNISVETTGEGEASSNVPSAISGTDIILSATPTDAHKAHFKEWQVISGTNVTINDNTFKMPHEDVKVRAVFENHSDAVSYVQGKAPTYEEYGWRGYYQCTCGRLFEDKNCTREIYNLDRWMAGRGRIDKLRRTTVIEINASLLPPAPNNEENPNTGAEPIFGAVGAVVLISAVAVVLSKKH